MLRRLFKISRNNGYVYVTDLNWDSQPQVIKSLSTKSKTIGKVAKVELLGSDIKIDFIQDENGLRIIPSGMIDSLSDIVNASLSKNVGCLKSLIVNLGSMMMILVYWLRVGLACVILTLAILIMISQ